MTTSDPVTPATRAAAVAAVQAAVASTVPDAVGDVFGAEPILTGPWRVEVERLRQKCGELRVSLRVQDANVHDLDVDLTRAEEAVARVRALTDEWLGVSGEHARDGRDDMSLIYDSCAADVLAALDEGEKP